MDLAIDLAIVGALALVYYFSKGRRPGWAPPLAIACLTVAGLLFFAETAGKPAKKSGNPLPTPEEARTTFDAAAIIANSDVDYHDDGIRIGIPAGYRYARMQEPMLLLATNEDQTRGIAVLRHELHGDDAEASVRATLAQMNKSNPTYEFSPWRPSRPPFAHGFV